ncbi:hypothetical protein HQ393_16150 [Chitinibacter bivalviorum]|uniref:Uncharacterized protein n=1 Tax=Chitinibacter bivalviorum TaxID=2739434 RepID=A0A7H9BM72_9NEIS|nr:hypothetical protein [Chitinibacter bivalviorum]QLG89655.1 hypothetical protein HQ393_16150 [Chitinibacter bivalviorum]
MRTKTKQSGAALLLILLLLGTVAAAMFVKALKARDMDQVKRQRSAEALQKARAALIAWSVSQPNAGGVPGQLPCPDTNAPGLITEGTAASSCAAGALGRFPWKTLKVEKIVDGWGEPLWYSLDGMYRAPTGARLLNSDVRATLQVYANDGTTLKTTTGNEAAAVLFAPGPALAGQNRAATTVASNYLEANSGRNNAIAAGPYIAGDFSATFNDQLLIITGREWVDQISTRLANEIKKVLAAELSVYSQYPNPALLSDARCADNNPTTGTAANWCASSVGICRGILPQSDAARSRLMAYPAWMQSQLWYRGIFYAVGNSVAGCGQLTVREAGKPDQHPAALFILPGTPLGSIVRIAATQTTGSLVSTNLADYLEDPSNQDAWGAGADDIYTVPTALSNDRLYVVP